MKDLDYWTRLKELQIMSLQRKREMLILILVWKIKNGFVVHTSGSVNLNNLQNATRKGVFYMLQTFSKDKKVQLFLDMSKIYSEIRIQMFKIFYGKYPNQETIRAVCNINNKQFKEALKLAKESK